MILYKCMRNISFLIIYKIVLWVKNLTTFIISKYRVVHIYINILLKEKFSNRETITSYFSY